MKQSEIKKLEATFKIKLPAAFESYVSSLVEEDPAKSKEGTIDLSPDSLGILFSFDKILKANKAVRSGGEWFSEEDPDWPNHFFVVGDNGCGDFYYIDLQKGSETVFFFDHEDGSAKKYASSLKGFVSSLRKQVIDYEKRMEGVDEFQKHYAAAKRKYHKTPIGQFDIATSKNDAAKARKLLKEGLKPNSRIPMNPIDYEPGPSLLGHAMYAKRAAIVKELLAAGLKFTNSDFHHAVAIGYIETVKVFLKFGADIKAKYKGKAAYELAIENNKRPLAAFLKKLDKRKAE